MACCAPAKCHCDLSAPAKPTTAPVPERAVNYTGHEMAKASPVHASAILLDSNGQLSTLLAVGTAAQRSTSVSLYAFSHAFLI
jgi:hypothetical protein